VVKAVGVVADHTTMAQQIYSSFEHHKPVLYLKSSHRQYYLADGTLFYWMETVTTRHCSNVGVLLALQANDEFADQAAEDHSRGNFCRQLSLPIRLWSTPRLNYASFDMSAYRQIVPHDL
jgi:hypothetical protein